MAPPATVDAAEASARSRFLKAPGRVAPGDALRAELMALNVQVEELNSKIDSTKLPSL